MRKLFFILYSGCLVTFKR